jgi:hypothetical protein
MRVRIALAAMAAFAAAGCGLGVSNPASGKLAPATVNKAASAKTFTFKGIAGNGRVSDHFTTWEHSSIRFKAIVDNPAGAKLTFKWDSNGHIWGKKDQQEANWSGPWDGWYEVDCTVTDEAGNKQTKNVSVKVWAVPTPPPVPHPPIPHP